ncbi:uncharacterized protein LOC130442601 isoform X1 [Diorhabda sublineata]|uniref:uncharacterized protein LOC130442601 isoform X1 n=1 Tax=Diorhabda sublineata TaxID=1163346 RepID=UPI0024E0D2F9|nr:uncharacterized protein LOC130442601 isoform X1 [Diorhabda sublineata]
MGDCCSKEVDSDSFLDPMRPTNQKTNTFSDIRVDSKTRYDELAVELLKRDLRDFPDMFMLNNMLMTIMFFENYRKDIQKLSLSSNNKIEKDINKTLVKNENMECICPDTVFETVNSNLKYMPMHGNNKYHSQPLLPRRLYVVTDCLDVISSMDVPQYTSIDKPVYQVRIEESTRKGFVRLKQLDHSKVPKIYSSPSEQPGTSSSNVNEPFYEYATIQDLKTPKRLEIVKNSDQRDSLPATCFTTRKIRKPNHELLDLQEELEENSELTEEDFFDKVIYVDAKGFMNYFKNVLFPNSLGRSLGFHQHEIEFAKSIPGTIFCNLSDKEDNPIPCEVIPSVAIEWPTEQTFEFLMREDRPTITDTNTGVRYKWPTDEMIKDIRTLNCVLVPKGYWKKKGEYLDATLEWEIAFPKAERYLEARMSHAQMRCFLLLILIHKHYIEPFTQQQGLLVEHIRCHMYWECESNYKDWPEYRLGSKLLKVIENLIKRLAKSELPDFFIKQKNHFRNIQKKYLLFAQKVLHELIQSPTVYLIKALRCIQYSKRKFYRPYDYKDLYIKITQLQGYKLVNPNLDRTVNFRRIVYQDPETQWRHLQELTRRKQYLETTKSETEELDTASVDSIDLDVTWTKQLEIFKSKAIFTEFITAFINIARDGLRISGNGQQSLFYLKQATYLTNILETIAAAFKPEALEFRAQITIEEERCKRSMAMRISDVPPETPVRNSIQFDVQTSQQLKNNVLNLTNLHKAYNETEVKISTSFKTVSPVARVKSDVQRQSIGTIKAVAFQSP